ncbi:hypothetical protein TTHERM_002653381, partial (macronuclear) [Tetrahymena thermophila SB210]
YFNMIFAGDQTNGSIFAFKYNEQTKMFELFMQFKALIDQIILDIFVTPLSKMLFISGIYSSIFFDMSQCLTNKQSCLSCSLQFYFSNSQTLYNQQSSYGQGQLDYPYTTYQSMIQSFLI